MVFHTAVLAYLERSARARFVDLVASMPGHWISNEGQGIVPGIESPRTDEGEGVPFLLALDGQAVAFAAPHGERLFWLE